MIAEIDACIKKNDDEALSLSRPADKWGYSEFYISRKFREISGMQFRDYLRYRRLAFALKELRDTKDGNLTLPHPAIVSIPRRAGYFIFTMTLNDSGNISDR